MEDKSGGLKSEKKGDVQEITIKINPRKILKGFIIVLVLVGVFAAGWISATMANSDFSLFSSDSDEVSAAATAEGDEKEEEAELEAVEEKKVVTPKPKPKEEPVPEVIEEPEEEEEVVVEEKEEAVTTDYSGVTLTLNEAYINWKGTWGKVSGIDYNIKNGADGTIKPDHFKMLMEGYDDVDKQFDVGFASKSIKSDVDKNDDVSIPDGFSYNEVTTGDLANVEISLYVYDSDKKLIASTKKAVDLNGE